MIFDAALGIGDSESEFQNDEEREKVIGLLVADAERGAAERVWKEVENAAVNGIEEGKKRSKTGSANVGRWVGVGLATVGGGVIIGLTGGLAAPLIGAGFGTLLTAVGVHATVAVGATAGAAIVGTLFGTVGGGLTAYKFNNRLRGLQTFQFSPSHTPSNALSLCIPVAGMINTVDDATDAWDFLPSFCPFSTVSPLTFDPHVLIALSNAYKALTFSAGSMVATEVLKLTVLHGVISAMMWPVALLKLSVLIDDPWHLALDRAKEAGVVLAREVLLRKVQGRRPVTLVGYSHGARVVYYCLLELAKESRKTGGEGAYGVVDGAYMFGAPVTGGDVEWREVRSVVAGRLVVGFCETDWLLSFLYRAGAAGQTVVGLRGAWVQGMSILREGWTRRGAADTESVNSGSEGSRSLPRSSKSSLGGSGASAPSKAPKVTHDEAYMIENYDLTDLVTGHLKYKDLLSEILERVGFEKGWSAGIWRTPVGGALPQMFRSG
ncbi:hypothetical protein HK097_005899 [Rhizophlyctis rosea]|uniref:DUF726-domain-containing protein n=1 Tax=Rhizophlyctis rosea TaxID=64517 RepID=A0AAD5SEM6_9FUNG|nr:hypothetical protein HK097_005899 [Rhizophlyctis rosea]